MAHHTFAIITLGCKVNQYESQKMREQLSCAGFTEVEPRNAPDILVVNTCTVTHVADRKSRQKIRQALRGNSTTMVIAAGCATLHESSDIRSLSPRVQFIGNRDKENLLHFIPFSHPGSVHSTPEASPFSRTRALLKVQDGCDHFCSYCIVPYVRGSSTSTPPGVVREEAVKLREQGYREIVITGIHLGAYGLDLTGERTLAGLLAELASLLQGVRIRLSSIEPADFTDSLLDVLTQYPTICPHIHLPLQHASPAVLERMNRGYTIGEYSDILERIGARLPGAAISTDIIVGFPGETERDFQLLLEFVRSAPFFRLHVFKYSPRKGTRAASFTGRVDESLKQQRSSLLIETGMEKARSYSGTFIGSTRGVLVEGRERGMLYGLTPQYLKVRFKGDDSLSGSLVQVHIDGHDDRGGNLMGTIT